MSSSVTILRLETKEIKFSANREVLRAQPEALWVRESASPRCYLWDPQNDQQAALPLDRDAACSSEYRPGPGALSTRTTHTARGRSSANGCPGG